MKHIRIQSGVSVRTAVYNSFRGVDFSVDPTLVDKTRSPWAPNMISDTGGMPEKRLGYRTVFSVEVRPSG